MRKACALLIALSCATSVFALDSRQKELKKWVKAFKDYQQWENYVKVNNLLHLVKRKPKPDPPSWLEKDCQDLLETSDASFVEACELLSEWKLDVVSARISRQARKERQEREKDVRSKFWEHIHLDGLWPMTEVGTTLFGVAGTHVTFPVTERFQLYAAPGFMVINQPDGAASRRWNYAIDWGFSFRVAEFRRADLHVNMAKAWVMDCASLVGDTCSVDLAGMSLTFKRK